MVTFAGELTAADYANPPYSMKKQVKLSSSLRPEL